MSHSLGVYDMKQFPLTLFSDGQAAVILFFVLSGFVLMYQSLNAQYNSYAFIIRRFFRIYPAFIFSIIFALILKEYFFVQENLNSTSEWFRSIWQHPVDTVLTKQMIDDIIAVNKINALGKFVNM